ncbi:hypothetical protein KUV22_02735 [Microbulbifer agarilyticus]|nr:hypothetical protein [Microbulbifer agarilyticus]
MLVHMRIFVLLLSVIFSPALFGESTGWSTYISEHGWATVSDTREGKGSLSEAIALVPDDVWLKHFRTFPSVGDVTIQNELHDFLASKYPELHNEALASAGNMHNPKVVALRVAFQEALMFTSLVTRINASLKSRCERITSASFEKFTIRNSGNQPTYSAMVWLSTKKCT